MLITLAGVGINMALAAVPIGTSGEPVIVAQEVDRGSPADLAGINPGDIVTQAGDMILPNPAKLRAEIDEAARDGESVAITVTRNGRAMNKRLRLQGGQPVIGIAYSLGRVADRHEKTIIGSFLRLGATYMTPPAYMFRDTAATANGPEGKPKVSGMVAAAYYTAQAMQTAKFRAWRAMLGVITMSMAIINMLPFPPLDGYQLVLRTIRATRGGRPLNDRLEHAMGMSRMGEITALVMYLIVQDMIQLLS